VCRTPAWAGETTYANRFPHEINLEPWIGAIKSARPHASTLLQRHRHRLRHPRILFSTHRRSRTTTSSFPVVITSRVMRPAGAAQHGFHRADDKNTTWILEFCSSLAGTADEANVKVLSGHAGNQGGAPGSQNRRDHEINDGRRCMRFGASSFANHDTTVAFKRLTPNGGQISIGGFGAPANYLQTVCVVQGRRPRTSSG
jgi:hypothetical protein